MTATKHFRKKFPVLVLEASTFLQWLIRLDSSATNSVYGIIKSNGDMHTKLQEKTMISRTTDPMVNEMGTKQMRPDAIVSLFIETYRDEDGHAKQVFFVRF